MPTPLGIPLLALVYYGAAKLGMAQGFLDGNVTPVWPPTGVALVALVVFGPRLWPGVAIGALAVNGLGGVPWAVACAMAAGNSAEALIGTLLLRRAGFRPALNRVREVVLFVGVSAGLATPVSASVGVLSLYLGGVIDGAALPGSWRVWWLGDVMGALVVAAPLLAILAGARKRTPGYEAVLLGAATVGSALLVFRTDSDLPVLVLPVVVWAALRFGQRGTALVTIGVAVVAVFETGNGHGPFAHPDAVHSLWLLDVFLGVLALTGLVLAAVVAERDRVAGDLRATLDGLEQRVEDQTAALRADRERLDEAQRIARTGSWEWELLTGRVVWSAEMLRIHGLEDAGAPPASVPDFLALVHGDDRPAVAAALRACPAAGFGPLEYRLLRPEGGETWISGWGERRRRADGVEVMQGTCADVSVRRAADAALRESEERFRLSFENAPIGMALVAPDGRWLKVNRSLCQITGYPPEVLLQKTFQDITHPEDLHADMAELGRALAGEITGYSREKRYLHAQGQVVWINLSVSLVRSEAGEPMYFISQIEDISTRKAHELDLARSHEILDRSQVLGRMGSWEWDIRGDGMAWSVGMCRIHGVLPGAPAPSVRGLLGLVHPDDAGEVRARLEQAAADGTDLAALTYRTVWPDGSVHTVLAQGSIAPGEPSVLTGFAQDITERREADDRFRALLESAPDAMVIVDDSGRIVLVNRQAESVFGCSREDLVGQLLEVLLPERLRAAHLGHRAAFAAHPTARPMGSNIELLARRADGEEFPVEISLSPLRTDQGTVVSAAIRDITARKRAEEALAHQALHDALTGLPNRLLLTDRLDLALARSARAGTGVAVLFLDLDRFKLINDTRGHATGDDVLVALADRLRTAVRPSDTVVRFGGDEFVVVCENTMATWEASMLADRISDAMRRPFDIGGEEIFLSVSIGVAVADPPGPGAVAPRTSAGLLRDADGAMYRAKERGRGGVEFFDESMRIQAAARLDTLNALHRAIDRRELRVFYQPIVDLHTGGVTGVEALVRWLHPERGLIGPADFIPIAEETGLIVPIGGWVLEEAALQAVRWRRQHPGRPPLQVSVNLSARQLRQRDLLGSVRSVLSRTGIDPASLCFELTESVLMDDIELHPGTLNALRELGIGLAIDDFGTGYSSLSYLKRFPVNVIKIDQQFVAGLGHDAYDSAIVQSTIDLAHSLGLTVAAEGVETEDQLDRLLTLGCDLAQGYFIARPVESAALDPMWSLDASIGPGPVSRFR